MMNYAETTPISTIVPLTQPLQNQCQGHAPDSLLSLLSALLTRPEFQHGLIDAQAMFLNEYEPVPLTEQEMIEDVEERLSCDGFACDKRYCELNGSEPPSYLYNLGLTVGTIATGLTYTDGHGE